MTKVQMLRALVKQRLTAAAEEIFGLFERTIVEYEEELCRSKEENHRQRQLLDAVLNPEVRIRATDVKQLFGSKEEIVSDEQECNSSLDQEEDSELGCIKEEQEELWTSQEGEPLEDSDVSPIPVKSEDDNEELLSSQLHRSRTQECTDTEPPASTSYDAMLTETHRKDCRELEAASESNPNYSFQQEAHDETSAGISEPDTKDSDVWADPNNPQAFLKTLKNNEFSVIDFVKPFSCFQCGKKFSYKHTLKDHMRTHTGEKRYICSECNKTFVTKGSLNRHMAIHKDEKPFVCSICSKRFNQRSHLICHMRCHTGEKPFSCSICKKLFTCSRNLRIHVRIHTGEKPFSCSICVRRFTQKSNLKKHMAVHAVEKRFTCDSCGKGFKRKLYFKKHKCCEAAQNDVAPEGL
ncbi:zinc finger protein 568-like [Thalassophryne amazonica]|uniref:zinc finger protein 568-like n=1 Tax=Thalassophryne amazonica TaxID=390379 RepID=UPI001470F070|nr:zinc finger protein 568-like [Thalassophryne amazonica]